MAQITYGRFGHSISVDVDESCDGILYWRYTINGAHFSEYRNAAFKSYELMLSEAKRDAETKADRLPAAE